jgi:predicted dehydrogenase
VDPETFVMSNNPPLNRRLRMGLVGGGGNAFIGRVHALAATLDARADLVAGALSSDPVRARDAAPDFGIKAERAYGSYRELIDSELQLPADQRIDFVSIATPNHTHFEIAKAALDAGLNVVCDKPMTTEIGHAEQLVGLVERSGAVFTLIHNYAGYPLVRQAREMILGGELGEIQAVRANYITGSLRRMVPGEAPTRGVWKVDPAKTGPSGTMGDIGIHAYHLIRYTTGLRPVEVSCNLRTFHPVRPLDDYGHALIRFTDDVVAMITVSQVTHGRLNDFSLEIDGTTGSLLWRQEEPNELIVRRYGLPAQIYERNPRAEWTSGSCRSASRLPGGHPEGFLEAFANIYRDSFDDMAKRAAGVAINAGNTIYPNVYDGMEGVAFVHQCVTSNRDNGAWQPLSQKSMG